MIYFDVTKTAGARHRSGLMRVTERLLQELGDATRAVKWTEVEGLAKAGDWYLTPELFSEAERPGFDAFLRRRRFRCAAIFHDAIPLRYPEITWPQSVARHPSYMKTLASFDRVWAVSDASRRDLVEFWNWQGVEGTAAADVLALGADFNGAPRSAPRVAPPNGDRSAPVLLAVGIIEPRKNQVLLLDICEELWAEGLSFELHIVGRVNPHFGAPIVARIKQLKKTAPQLSFHEGANDETLAALYARADATVFPTIAEGCGLPVLESLWQGLPCVASDLPVLRENADGGGCVLADLNDRASWKNALRRILTDRAWTQQLASEAYRRLLPTWSKTAAVLVRSLT